MNSNYPDGARNDPNAPWNEDDRYEREVEQYIADAENGTNTDWATYDESESAGALIDVYAALRSRNHYLATDLIEALIKSAAERHAQSVVETAREVDVDRERDRRIDDALTGDIR